jgi:hypothetical protein
MFGQKGLSAGSVKTRKVGDDAYGQLIRTGLERLAEQLASG